MKNYHSIAHSELLTISHVSVIYSTGVHSSAAYKELIENLELFNKICCFLIIGSLTVIFLADLPFSYVLYYIFDLGEDSFYLFLPAWFVFIVNDTPLKMKMSILSSNSHGKF